MKNIFYLMMILCVLVPLSTAYPDLTKQDIEEIRKIVREEIQVLRQEMNTRINDLDKKLSERINDLDKKLSERITDLRTLLYVILAGMFTLMVGMFAIVGFVLWDRRTALAPAVRKAKELEEEEEKIKRALREYAMQEPRLAAVLKQVGIL